MLEVLVMTEIVIPHEVDYLDTRIDHRVKLCERADKPRRHNRAIIEPVVEEVTNDYDVRRGLRDSLQRGKKTIFPLSGVLASPISEVHIRQKGNGLPLRNIQGNLGERNHWRKHDDKITP